MHFVLQYETDERDPIATAAQPPQPTQNAMILCEK